MENQDAELWIVSGRVCGDDDDTVMCIEVRPGRDAQTIFEEEMLEDIGEQRPFDEHVVPPVFINECCTLADFAAKLVRKAPSDPAGASDGEPSSAQ